MKTIIVGDIHGCHAELLALLDVAGIGAADRIVAIGDVSDRGPESAEVLDFFLTRPNTLSIMGNHEWKHGRGINGLSQRITRAQCGEALYARAVAWMRERPLWLDLPEILLIHWGLMPGVPLEDQHHAVLTGEPAGEMSLREMLGNEAWYDAYPGPKPVAYGHHSWAAGARRNLTYGLDTGCVYGLSLTGLLLPEFQLVSVPARENHWEKTRARWERSLMEGTQLVGSADDSDDET
ncbi:MAG: metallophosphoesterase [Candidatus Krumholzibacteriia bacterium]